jgi:rRNA-processing protein FCF1
MFVFDTSVIAIAFDQNAAVPLDPVTAQPLHKCKERIDLLLSSIAQRKLRIMIPAPVVAEYVAGGGKHKNERLEIITKNKSFLIGSFDLKAAVECSMLKDGDAGKNLTPMQTKAKVKFDRQVIAIALANAADTVVTGDEGLGKTAKQAGLNVIYPWDLPLPTEDPQLHFDYSVQNGTATAQVPSPG